MQRHHKPGPQSRGALSQGPRHVPKTQTKSRGKPSPRVGKGAVTSESGSDGLTAAQQMEAQAARSAVAGAMGKSFPQVAKKFVESISLDVDVETTRQLLLSKKGFVALPSSMGVLCRQLRKLDLSGNDLTDLSPMATLQQLSNLNLAHNDRLASLKGLSGTCLSVLNISFCAVESLEGLEHTALTLRTFIANDNRLHFHSPIFGAVATPVGEKAVEWMAAREHLPEAMRGGLDTSEAVLQAVAQKNYIIFSTFQQCETVVLSRNTRLCHFYPTWSAGEAAAALGAAPGRGSAVAGDEGGDETPDDVSNTSADGDDESPRGEPRRRCPTAQRHRAGEGASSSMSQSGSAGARELAEDSPEMVAYQQRRSALALAHPLSVFEQLPRLKKLSLSGCELHSLPVRWFLPKVTELRLAQNHLTSLQPDGVILRSLHILDISNNLFTSVETVRRCRYLEQLNVRGNPLIEQGVLQDRARGLTKPELDPEETAVTPTSGTGPLPITVQQRVLRLFPSINLLDGQPLMPVEQVHAAYMQRNARSVVEGMKTPGKDDGDDTVIVNALHGMSEKACGAHTALGEEEQGVTSGEASRTAATACSEAPPPAFKARRIDPTVIAAEADERDVVVEAPTSVVKAQHASIVRRERVLLHRRPTAASENDRSMAEPKRKYSKTMTSSPAVVYGQLAVTKLLEKSRTSAW